MARREYICEHCEDTAEFGGQLLAIVDRGGFHQIMHRACAEALKRNPDSNRQRIGMTNYLDFAVPIPATR